MFDFVENKSLQFLMANVIHYLQQMTLKIFYKTFLKKVKNYTYIRK